MRVPEESATISGALDLVSAGGTILVGEGVYAEEVAIDVPDITIRGTDRNRTVIDGEGLRPYGIVATADGVRIENLTVTRATFYGVLVTGFHDETGGHARDDDGYSGLDVDAFPPVQRFKIDHVTAYNNGLYGIYAFDAQNGSIVNSYASGSADSGIYVGQCEECNILVQNNVAENNAVGFENSNASDSVWVVSNRFSGNRIGMTFLSSHQEALTPQRGNSVIGNVVSNNNTPQSPAHGEGSFGIGIGVSGGMSNTFEKNVVSGNDVAGVLLSSAEDMAPLTNTFLANTFTQNAIDMANIATQRAPASGNCVVGEVIETMPTDFLSSCVAGNPQPATTADALPFSAVPPGVSFLAVAPPPDQPNLQTAGEQNSLLPDTVTPPPLDEVATPPADLLHELSRAQ
ncbi:right-handed parallel beta-helix repeat-containing protein [Microbacterium sp. NPDC076911]|uniref:right-handed parallel beta-helix repeat-containing protein n=1 Tax=Microbacterium sp. NPDC076911 TaxID=3154958 RepID=UPI0034452379